MRDRVIADTLMMLDSLGRPAFPLHRDRSGAVDAHLGEGTPGRQNIIRRGGHELFS